MRQSEKKYVDGVPMTSRSHTAIVTALTERCSDKASARAYILKTFGEDMLFELNWSGSMQQVFDSLIRKLSSEKRVAELMEKGFGVASQAYIATLLGEGALVLAADIVESKYVDTDVRLLAEMIPDIAGGIIQAVGSTGGIMTFVEQHFNGYMSKIDWTGGAAKAAVTLVTLCNNDKKLGVLFSRLEDAFPYAGLQTYAVFLGVNGVIRPAPRH